MFYGREMKWMEGPGGLAEAVVERGWAEAMGGGEQGVEHRGAPWGIGIQMGNHQGCYLHLIW